MLGVFRPSQAMKVLCQDYAACHDKHEALATVSILITIPIVIVLASLELHNRYSTEDIFRDCKNLTAHHCIDPF